MKKLVSILLTLALCLGCTCALAAGKLNVVQENTYFVVTDYSKNYYAYAKVENSGDKAIMVNDGLLEVYDAEGTAITSSDWPETYARYLQPGEYTYVSFSCYEGFEEGAEPNDYALTLTGKANKDNTNVRFPVETELKLNVQEDEWNTYDYMYATVTNSTDEVVYDLYVVLALLDADGNILYVESEGLYGSVGLNPGSSITVRAYISSDFMEYFEKNNLTPTSVDAIAYVEMEAE